MEPSSSCESTSPVGYSDEDIILASSRPKKRAGRKKFNETRHPIYHGVRNRNSNKWVCELREPNNQKRVWLGTYPSPEMAARAYDVAALAFRGNRARLNFADSVWRLPVPASGDVKDIQKAAAEAAELFRTLEEGAGASGSDQSRGDTITVDRRERMLPNLATLDTATSLTECDLFRVNEDLLTSMRGVLLSPPPCLDHSFSWDDLDTDAEMVLWSYSI